MSRRKQANRSKSNKKRRSVESTRRKNKTLFLELCNWFTPEGELFSKDEFHGNTKWQPEQLATQALIWSWQETKFVTDAFEHTQEVCDDLGLVGTAKSYTSLINALDRYRSVFGTALRERFQVLAEEVGGRHFETDSWVLMGFDGSRATAPRTVSNERAFCAPDYGRGKRAKYGKKKSKGMRRKRNQQNPPQPQAPQAWITLLWHMGLRLPWTWRLGPSNSSERDHVKEIVREEEFPENTLFCGDAGFTGYPLWSLLLARKCSFLVRVGANVNLLSEQADVKQLGGGIVLCWPKGKMDSGQPPLRLRLARVKVGKTKMWMLTNVLNRKQLSHKQIVRYYKMRWGIEVEFRGLKQTIDKHTLRCRNANRLLVELDWSIRAMAVAELLALREQLAAAESKEQQDDQQSYDPVDRSLANTMRALRKCMRNLDKYSSLADGLMSQLSRAFVERYHNRTNKRARYRRKNPDKKALGEPTVRKLNAMERKKLRQHLQSTAA
jgi:hypothetical protein